VESRRPPSSQLVSSQLFDYLLLGVPSQPPHSPCERFSLAPAAHKLQPTVRAVTLPADPRLATATCISILNQYAVSAQLADQRVIERFLSHVLTEFADCFLEHLPSGLPTSRRVEFDMNMKPGGKTSSQAPFRLSQTEQDALDLFVTELLERG
jgi:hypothetical protein